jgi:hypothetical protein
MEKINSVCPSGYSPTSLALNNTIFVVCEHTGYTDETSYVLLGLLVGTTAVVLLILTMISCITFCLYIKKKRLSQVTSANNVNVLHPQETLPPQQQTNDIEIVAHDIRFFDNNHIYSHQPIVQ